MDGVGGAWWGECMTGGAWWRECMGEEGHLTGCMTWERHGGRRHVEYAWEIVDKVGEMHGRRRAWWEGQLIGVQSMGGTVAWESHFMGRLVYGRTSA